MRDKVETMVRMLTVRARNCRNRNMFNTANTLDEAIEMIQEHKEEKEEFVKLLGKKQEEKEVLQQTIYDLKEQLDRKTVCFNASEETNRHNCEKIQSLIRDNTNLALNNAELRKQVEQHERITIPSEKTSKKAELADRLLEVMRLNQEMMKDFIYREFEPNDHTTPLKVASLIIGSIYRSQFIFVLENEKEQK